MKVKRILTCVTAGVLGAAVLTSCSEAELRYLSFSNEMSQWNMLSESGDMTITLNKENMAEFINDVSSSEEDIDVSAIPFETISFVYTGEADIENNRYYVDMDIAVDDKEPYTIAIYVDEDGIVYEKSFIDSLERFINDYFADDVTAEQTAPLFEFLDEYLAGNDSFKIMYDDTIAPNLNSASQVNKLLGVMTGFMTTAFDGYTTSSYELNGTNGVTAVFNYDNVVKAINDLFDYYIDNSDKVNAEWDKISGEVNGIISEMAGTETQDGEIFSMPSAEDVSEMRDEFNALVYDKSYSPVKDILTGSEYSFDTTKNDDGSYTNNFELDLNYKGADLADISGTENTSETDQINIKEYNPFILTDENMYKIDSAYSEWVNREYPADSVDIMWHKNDSYCIMAFTRPEISDDINEMFQFVIVDDRVYVEMRPLVEGMGYSIEWDEANQKAYVTDGENRYELETVLINGTSFVKVRDFEKLGMTVEYTEEDGVGSIRCTATVKK